MKKFKQWFKQLRWYNKVFYIYLFFAFFASIIVISNPSSPGSSSIERQQADSQQLSPEENRLIQKLGPKPYGQAEVMTYLQGNLKDPDSLADMECSRVTPMEDIGGWGITCRYRAKNSFGGYVIEQKHFILRNGSVVIHD